MNNDVRNIKEYVKRTKKKRLIFLFIAAKYLEIISVLLVLLIYIFYVNLMLSVENVPDVKSNSK